MSASSAPEQGRNTGPVAGISARYADALFDLAIDEGAVDAVEADLNSLGAAIVSSAELKSFLASPLYGADEQLAAVSELAKSAGFSPLPRNFLALVAKNRRLFALAAMIRAFRERLAAHRGEMSAEALAAAPLSDEQVKRLRAEIEAKVGKAVNLSVAVDPELLGGLVVKIGSIMIDSSLKTKLNRLKSVMKEA